MSAESQGHPPHKEGLDYSEPHDIARLHAAAMREKQEPRDGNEPLSLWMVCFFGTVLVLGGIYLGLFSGGFRADAYSIFDGGVRPRGGGATTEAAVKKELTPLEIGEKVYKQNCQVCHQANGMGVAGAFPPLAGSEWVLKGDRRLTQILLHGVGGTMVVNGTTYNGAMPPWNALDDKKLAGVISYIRQAWGNTAGPVTPEQVAIARADTKARTSTWTEAELRAIPEGENLPAAAAAPAADPNAVPPAGAPPADPNAAPAAPVAPATSPAA